MGQGGKTTLDTLFANLKEYYFLPDLMKLHFPLSPFFLKYKCSLELSCGHVDKHNSFATKTEYSFVQQLEIILNITTLSLYPYFRHKLL